MPAYDEKQFLPWENQRGLPDRDAGPDGRSGAVYLFDSNLKLATETAIITRRPLLLRGEPGCGKSSFAPFAARNLNWRYYEMTITGRTEARDLLWRFDALARLHDAHAKQSGGSVSPIKYIDPSVLWWAFNREDALKFLRERERVKTDEQPAGATKAEVTEEPVDLSEPFATDNQSRDLDRTVVLIDEIDKADPDVPNDLLEAFGLNSFVVDEIGWRVPRKATMRRRTDPRYNQFGDVLVVITTNQERDLPQAFLRRCVVHTIEEPKDPQQQVDRLLEIAKLHLKTLPEMAKAVANKTVDLRAEAKRRFVRGPSTAEFLDTLLTCKELGITVESELWKRIERSVLVKDLDGMRTSP